MDEKERIRRKVWEELRRAARPDSRFHWDFSAFIPDFAGSEQCAATLAGLDAYRQARIVLAAPDNSLARFRAQCLRDGKRLIVPTYATARGFWQIEAGGVPAGQEAFAATLDGLEEFAQPYPLERAGPQDAPGLVVTGASVLSTEGVRVSAGPSYFDLEWIVLARLGLVSAATPVAALVHDCQVVAWAEPPQPYDAVVDTIITPTRIIETGGRHPKPDGAAWKRLPRSLLAEAPLLRRLLEEAQDD